MSKATGAKARYEKLIADLEEIAKRHGGIYLTDWMIDAENAIDNETGRHLTEDDGDAFWNAMYASATSAAHYRAAEHGLDINREIGRTIF